MTKNHARFETVCHADIGARNEQQDRAGIFEKEDACLIAVADGMGGHSGGALAAETVVETARSLFEEADVDADAAGLLASIILQAHERIVELGAERQLDPHSTCVLLYLTAAGAHWAHAGDSRLYRLADGRIAERTLDHSKVEQLRLEGRITEEEMATHPNQNWVLQALGGWDPPEISTGSAPPGADDAFLLATDGLWENVIPAGHRRRRLRRRPRRGTPAAGGPCARDRRTPLRQHHRGGRAQAPGRAADLIAVSWSPLPPSQPDRGGRSAVRSVIRP